VTFSNLGRSLFFLCLAQPNESEIAETRTLFATADWSWDLWLELCRHNRIESICRLNIGRWQLKVPAHIQVALGLRADEVTQANSQRWLSATSVFQRFAAKNIPWIVLKGNAIAESIYQTLGYKQMNDIDILVRREDLQSVRQIFTDENLVSAAEITHNDGKLQKISHHWPPFATTDLNCFFGTHWNIVSPLRDVHVDEKSLWKRKVATSVAGLKTFRLGDADYFSGSVK
jgi:hypothetical protein